MGWNWLCVSEGEREKIGDRDRDRDRDREGGVINSDFSIFLKWISAGFGS